MSHIPNEIYLIIFECIAPTDKPLSKECIKTFLALALVCRLFRAITLPRVFKRVVLSRSAFDANGIKWHYKIMANMEPPKLFALYVKECYIRYRYDCFAPDPLGVLYRRAMARMSNIQKVVFYRSHIYTEHLEIMRAMKQLESLTLHTCFIGYPIHPELSVRTVKSLNTVPPRFHLPIAISTLRTLETDMLKIVLKLPTQAARQCPRLALEHLVLHDSNSNVELLIRVLERLPDLESVTLVVNKRLAASPLISGLSLKRLFPRLRSFTANRDQSSYPLRRDTEKVCCMTSVLSPDSSLQFVLAICDGPGTLPSLERLDLMFRTVDKFKTTLDIVFDLLESTILPAFPNIKCICTKYGKLRLEKGGWKRVNK